MWPSRSGVWCLGPLRNGRLCHSPHRNDHTLVRAVNVQRLHLVGRSHEPPRDDDGEHDDEGDSKRELKDFPNVRNLRVHVFPLGTVTARP